MPVRLCGYDLFSQVNICTLALTMLTLSLGRITGGSLKTPAQEDKESIQAQWLPANIDELVHAVPIRAMDCLGPIQIGNMCYSAAMFHFSPHRYQVVW